MKILFEDYTYNAQDIPILEGIDLVEQKTGGVKLPYVGYYHDLASTEAIFILPKVFIVKGLAFGHYQPEYLLSISDENKQLPHSDRSFLFGLSAWIYQAIALYNERHTEDTITSPRTLTGVIGRRGEGDATLLDHILALLRFGKQHQSLFTYIATIMHSGQHKVDWVKTIRSTSPILKDRKPYYLDCKTKEKTINYDEELICLFYSTLDYLKTSYCFVVKRNLNYKTEKSHRIADLINSGKGTKRLRKIRGKYFTDELVQLWNLLYAFYERAEAVAQKKVYNERLLVRNFNLVFEDMIDCLIGESSPPSELKYQKDGKIVDHIYRDKSLIEDGEIYFIGDSKYYKEGNTMGKTARYKQFTYAKNIIQYNIDLFNENQTQDLRYRDELTEGYNPTPNFFIRGFIDPDDLSYSDIKLTKEGSSDLNFHFKNRLFDRDTLLVLTYEINFLYVLSGYVLSRSTSSSINRFLRSKFRDDIIEAFEAKYDFYEVQPPHNISSEEFVKQNFYLLIGKIYKTSEGKLILALEKTGGEENRELLALKHFVNDMTTEKLRSLSSITS